MYMHHEMIDGKGYPQGLKGDEIPLMARIVSVADAFDAMTTERPYQSAMKFDEALHRIRGLTGSRYDPNVVAAFIAACESGQIRPGSVKPRRRFEDATIGGEMLSDFEAIAPPQVGALVG
jgi:HD-GYP domain-containing protein (c-di-GMP phosphodiesterase class II)